jgi:hypothetical protein
MTLAMRVGNGNSPGAVHGAADDGSRGAAGRAEQNLRAVATVIFQKPLSISGWQRDMIDEVVASVATGALSGRTSWFYDRSKCNG